MDGDALEVEDAVVFLDGDLGVGEGAEGCALFDVLGEDFALDEVGEEYGFELFEVVGSCEEVEGGLIDLSEGVVGGGEEGEGAFAFEGFGDAGLFEEADEGGELIVVLEEGDEVVGLGVVVAFVAGLGEDEGRGGVGSDDLDGLGECE